MFSKKEFAISNLTFILLAGQISCSAELSMKKSFLTSGPGVFVEDLYMYVASRDSVSEQRRPWSDCVAAQADLSSQVSLF